MKATAGVFISLILYIVLSKESKDHSVLLSILVCALLAMLIIQKTEPVLAFLKELAMEADFGYEFLGVLLRAVGIGIVSEFASVICADSGNAAMGKMLSLLATIMILWISLPLFQKLLELIMDLMKAI